MKKLVLILAIALGFTAVAVAQPKAIGGRLGGWGVQASYEHYLGGDNFIEATLGIDPFNDDLGFNVTGIYNFVFATPSWSSKGSWAWYAGPGISGGTMFNDKKDVKDSKAYFGIIGQVGLEYQFWFPLQLSADLRPMVAFCKGDTLFRTAYAVCPTISVRYMF